MATPPKFPPFTKKKAEVKEEPKESKVETAVETAAETDENDEGEGTPMTDATPEKTEKKPRKPRSTAPNRQLTPEDMKYVVENVGEMSYAQMAEARGITKHQVNRVLMEVKKNLRESAAGNPEKEAIVEKYISEKLSRPEDAFGGKGTKSSPVKDAVKGIVDDIVGDLKL